MPFFTLQKWYYSECFLPVYDNLVGRRFPSSFVLVSIFYYQHHPFSCGERRRIFIRCDIRLAVGMVARIMAPRENNVYVSLGQWEMQGSIHYHTCGRCKCSKESFFALVLKLSWAVELFILCKWKALGVVVVWVYSQWWSEKMPQAFFDSYGNLVRFPARCSPSCSHFSFFQFHFFFQALPPSSFSFSLKLVV